MTLTGPQSQQLHAALLSAFPTRGELTQMVRFALSENLDTIATGNLSDVAFALIRWAEARGKLPALLDGALSRNPGNLELQEAVDVIQAALAVPPTTAQPQATSSSPQRVRVGRCRR